MEYIEIKYSIIKGRTLRYEISRNGKVLSKSINGMHANINCLREYPGSTVVIKYIGNEIRSYSCKIHVNLNGKVRLV